MDYQRVSLVDGSPIGQPGPLPADLQGGLSDADLARLGDLPSASPAYAGLGFVPVTRAISALAFKQRLTAEERIAIRSAAASDPVIADFLDLLGTPGSGMIELDHPDTVAGVDYLVAHDLLTEDRAAAIRA